MNNDDYESTPIRDSLYSLVNDDINTEIGQRIYKCQSLNRACISTINDRVWNCDASDDEKEALNDVIYFLLMQSSLLNTLVKNIDKTGDKLMKLGDEYKNTESIIKLIKLN